MEAAARARNCAERQCAQAEHGGRRRHGWEGVRGGVSRQPPHTSQRAGASRDGWTVYLKDSRIKPMCTGPVATVEGTTEVGKSTDIQHKYSRWSLRWWRRGGWRWSSSTSVPPRRWASQSIDGHQGHVRTAVDKMVEMDSSSSTRAPRWWAWSRPDRASRSTTTRVAKRGVRSASRSRCTSTT